MDDITARSSGSVTHNSQGGIGQQRVVPGPKSKAIFDREAEAMAPGLQSIALYSHRGGPRARLHHRRRRWE